MLTPRPYQREAIAACESFLASREDNPAIVLPTGAGKSLVMALMLHKWIEACPPFRAMVLAHRKELVSQNAAELEALDPTLSVGVFSAALRRRETMRSITFAGIDSVANKAHVFGHQDVLLIDEAHRIPARGEGKYRKFIADCKAINPRLRVIGLTATPYRMGIGSICHEDHILNEVCYSANLGDLIRDGYLSDIRTIRGEADIDLQGVKKTGGEFNLKDLATRVDRADVIGQAVKHLVQSVRRTERKSVILFCIDVEHCKHVSEELRKYGIEAPYILGSTPNKQRDKLVEDFKAGRYQYLVSVNVFFEGFNAKRVDCVAMLRPTQSKGLWVQAVGRGLRLYPDKDYCLVLDYGDNINRHGPIDLDGDGEVKLATCEGCLNEFSRAVKCCPSCGWEIPPVQREMFEQAEERERQLHEARAAEGELLNQARWLKVDGAVCRLHRKAGKPDSLRIEYQCGLTVVKEWICIDHEAYASAKARDWLRKRGMQAESVAEFFERYSSKDVTNATKRILCKYDGKHLSVVDYELAKK